MSSCPISVLSRPDGAGGDARSTAGSHEGAAVKTSATAERTAKEDGGQTPVNRVSIVRTVVEDDATRLQRRLDQLMEAATRVHYLMKLAHRNAATLRLAPPESAGGAKPESKGLSTWTPSKTGHTNDLLHGVEKILSVLAQHVDSVWAWNEEEIAMAAERMERLSHQLERIK